MKGAVAGLMTHSETTADKQYYIFDKMQKASTAGDAIRKFFNPDEQLHKSQSRHKLSKDEVNKLSVVVGSSIESGDISMASVRSTMGELSDMNTISKQIYDKVRRLHGHSPKKL